MRRPPITNHRDSAYVSHQHASSCALFIKSFVSSHELMPLLDYKIAQDSNTSSFVYFGSLDNGLMPLVEDVQRHGTESLFYGNVFCSLGGVIDREGDGAAWHIYKNKAFWAGAIDAQRSFYLLTDIAWYYETRNIDPLSGTCMEILWLLNNGYTAYPDPSYLRGTIFTPPRNPPVLSIIRYENQRHDVERNTNLLQGFIAGILGERKNLEFSQGERHTPDSRHARSELIFRLIQKAVVNRSNLFSMQNIMFQGSCQRQSPSVQQTQ